MTEHEHFLINTVDTNGSNNNEIYDVPVGELIIIKIDYKIISTRIYFQNKKSLAHRTNTHVHTHLVMAFIWGQQQIIE